MKPAHHARPAVATGVAASFCDPRSPWQRGRNESTSSLLLGCRPGPCSPTLEAGVIKFVDWHCDRLDAHMAAHEP